MKAVILAGGFGSRLSEETDLKPKPLVEIGDMPILWHIMKIYSTYGINNFIICLGYKGYMIKEFFYNYLIHKSNIQVDLKNNNCKILNNNSEPWTIKLIDTGLNTMTGGRLKRILKYVKNEDFCFTYGDGVSDINIRDLINFHKNSNKIATLTAVSPIGRFGSIKIKDNLVKSFDEKPIKGHGLINGGFFVLSPRIIDYLDSDSTVFEKEPLENLAKNNQLMAFNHFGFWQCMDTLRDKKLLEDYWKSNNAPWKVW